MRVISGRLGGRKLLGPPRGLATRPTSDKVREALFSMLGDEILGAVVLDLFAGTGALGIEALSRGAKRAVFVDAERALCAVVQSNLDALGLGDRAKVVRCDVRRLARNVEREGPYQVVFVDPPYQKGLEWDALDALVREKLVAAGAWVVVEYASRDELQLPPRLAPHFVLGRQRSYGDTSVACYYYCER